MCAVARISIYLYIRDIYLDIYTKFLLIVKKENMMKNAVQKESLFFFSDFQSVSTDKVGAAKHNPSSSLQSYSR